MYARARRGIVEKKKDVLRDDAMHAETDAKVRKLDTTVWRE